MNDPQTMPSLLPCPCGSPVTLHYLENEQYSARCDACQCRLLFYAESKHGAIEWYNAHHTRSPASPTISEELARDASVMYAHHLALNWSAEKAMAHVLGKFTAALEAAGLGGEKWIPCAERMPPSGIYLFYRPEAVIDDCRYGAHIGTAFYYSDEEGDHFTADYHGPVAATHWRPLPKGPTP